MESPPKFRPLTEEDVQKLKKNIWNGTFIGIHACLFFTVLGGAIALFFLRDGLQKIEYVIGMLMGIGMALMGLFFLKVLIPGLALQRNELKGGVKIVFSGTVQNLRRTEAKIVDDTEVLFRKSQNIVRWYIAIDQDEYEVDKIQFEKFAVGDLVTVNLSPDSGLLLSLTKLAR